MSITAEKISSERIEELRCRAQDVKRYAPVAVRPTMSVYVDDLLAILSLLQQGEPEGWREAKRIADLWFEPWGAAKAIEWEFSGDVPFTPENALRKIQRLLSASPLPPAPGAETLSEMVERKCKADVPDRALATPPAEGETK